MSDQKHRCRRIIVHGAMLAITLVTLTACGESSSDNDAAARQASSNAPAAPTAAQIAQATEAVTELQRQADEESVAGIIRATLNNEPRTWYVTADGNLNEYEPDNANGARIEIMGAPDKNDFTWNKALSLAFDAARLTDTPTASGARLNYHSMGATSFHTATNVPIVLASATAANDHIKLAGTFTGTVTYRSYRDEPLEGEPETIEIKDGAFYAHLPK